VAVFVIEGTANDLPEGNHHFTGPWNHLVFPPTKWQFDPFLRSAEPFVARHYREDERSKRFSGCGQKAMRYGREIFITIPPLLRSSVSVGIVSSSAWLGSCIRASSPDTETTST
jgi:hypothetical protein